MSGGRGRECLHVVKADAQEIDHGIAAV